MALINGNDYDHIDFTKNGVTTRHMLKDALSRQMSGDLVKVQNEEPTSEGTKIWIKPSGDSEVQVPTYEEFEELSDKIDDADATIESLAVSAQPTVSVTEVDGHKRFSFGIPASNGIASITKTATDGVIDTYTIAMTDGTSTSFSVNNSDITPESMAEAIATALQDYARIDGYYPDLTAGNADQLNSTKFVENKEPYLYRPSGGTSDIGNRKYLDAIVGVSLPWNQMVRDEASENQTDFADILTVTDAVEDAASLKVKIEPQQDLHGYDHPWPAGGGVNKIDVNQLRSYGTTYGLRTSFDGDWIVLSGEYTFTSQNANFRIATLRDTSVFPVTKFKAFPDSNTSPHMTSAPFGLADGNKTLTIYISGMVQDETYNLRFKIVGYEGDTAPTEWTPYSNICPINGWDGVQVWDDPKYGGLIEWNQLASSLNPSVKVYGITRSIVVNDGIRGLQYTGTSELTTNYTACAVEEMYFELGHVYLFDLGCDLPSGCRISVSTLDQERSRILTPTNVGSRSFGVVINSGTIVDFIAYPQVFDLTRIFGAGNEPTTVEEFRALFPADYYPYNAGEITTVSVFNGNPYRHYSIALPTEAGTVYGGELTVNEDGSGSLVVDWQKIKMSDVSWSYSSSNARFESGYMTSAAVATIGNLNVICSRYKAVTNRMGTDVKNGEISYNSSNPYNPYLIVKDDQLTSKDDFIASLTDNDEIIYRLRTPVTYPLTASEIRTLLGTNNIWADTGDLALTYTGTDEHLVLKSGKKYLARINGTDSMLLGSGQEITATKGTDNVFDLTKMFGTSVADYVYNQGAGYFRKWFGKTWYPYNTGELKHVEGLESHDVVGFNMFDPSDIRTGGAYNPAIGATVTFTASGASYSGTNPIIIDVTTGWRGCAIISRPLVYGQVYRMTLTTSCPSVGDKRVSQYLIDENNVVVTNPYNYVGNSSDSIIRSISVPRGGLRCVVAILSTSAQKVEVHDACIYLAHNGSRNGEYEPYEKHSYPLDSTVILRGIPKVGANGVYWDGDRYLPDGTVERRYGVVDLGTLEWNYGISNMNVFSTSSLQSTIKSQNAICNIYTINQTGSTASTITSAADMTMLINVGNGSTGNFRIGTIIVKNTAFTDTAAFKSAMSGVMLVYELAEPTIEQATPYRNFQLVDDWGTEEFVTTGMIPVGHESRYPANLRDKLQHLPDAASSNGSYLITQTDGQMTLTPFPAPPTTAGKYALRATVTNGVATFAWEATT